MEERCINNNKNLSLGDLVLNIGKLIKEYEKGITNEKEEITKNDNLVSINEVIEIYPLLSKHLITNAINNGDLKVTWIGNKRYFRLEDIDSYLKYKEDKNSNNISDTIKSWRNN